MPLSEASRRQIPVLYEDAVCVVFDKPPGLLVVPADEGDQFTLTEIVNRQHNPSEPTDPTASASPMRLHPCHRLDRDTSGVIIFAKGKRNQQLIMDIFNERKVSKHYTAFVHGKLERTQGEISEPVRDLYQKKFAARSAAKPALTKYRVLEQRRDFCVVDVLPVTGRTNQIRIHFAGIKHALVGEDKYAFRKDYKLKFKRTALHAREIEWPHPLSKKSIRVAAELPDDMKRFLEQH